jgi:hypothetical protein
MAKQQPNPDAGKRQPNEPERPVESFEEDLADSVHEPAKSSDKDERAVAKAVIDLETN